MLRGTSLAAGLLGLIVLCAACRPGRETRAVDAGLPARPTAPPPQIALPLPPGWTVTAAADGTVRASSPRGQVVLRAELERGVGLPTAATLRSGFLGGLRRLRGRSESVVEAPGFVAMRFVLFDPDGGAGEPEALLSATALGEDTLLCSSLRGATPAELTVILAACQSARSAGR
ncbi:MAG TPA: hypothetical protein VEJ89_04950 [Myxococcaceae bacterium]|jgi:hypothetical protein|nr:hypothetical protein [Myxococcaceae bacterium]